MKENLIKNIENIKGKRVFLRLELNVPIENNKIIDSFRIDKALPIVLFLKEKGARIIIAGHIGRDKSDTLLPVFEYINKHTPTRFISDVYDKEALNTIKQMNDGDIVMLENLRKWSGETENSEDFGNLLASFADIFVNDAFAVSHRKHSSIVGIPKRIPSYIGLQFEEEIKHLSLALKPKHPFLFIVGGAKFATKLPIVQKFLDVADSVFVGGALANTIFKFKGIEVGKSRADTVDTDLETIIKKDNLKLPTDVVVETGNKTEIRRIEDIKTGDIIMDIGPETTEKISALICKMRLVLWNGPLGNYEKGFDEATKRLLLTLAKDGETVILGGGDTVALVSKMGIADKFTFISTGGGAMLAFLSEGCLCGFEAVKNSNRQ